MKVAVAVGGPVGVIAGILVAVAVPVAVAVVAAVAVAVSVGLIVGVLVASALPWSGAAGAPGAPQGAALSDLALSDRGRALFAVKGCIACHRHGNVTVQKEHDLNRVGPDLSRYSADPAYLRQWLADPAPIRPRTRMPDLALADGEIEALVRFLNGPPGELP